MLAEAVLRQDLHLAFLDPFLIAGLGADPAERGMALDFAALHREVDLRGVGVAADDLEFGAEDRIGDHRHVVGRGPGTDRADDGLGAEQIGERLRARLGPDHHDLRLGRRTADPLEAREVEAHRLGRQQRCGRDAVGHHAEHRAVARRDVVELVHQREARRARHVLHDRGRIARQVFAEVARQQPRGEIVAAARPGADADLDPLAAIEFLDALCVRRGGEGDTEKERDGETEFHAHAAPAEEFYSAAMRRSSGVPIASRHLARLSPSGSTSAAVRAEATASAACRGGSWPASARADHMRLDQAVVAGAALWVSP